MSLFTTTYTKARDVAQGQKFAEPDWDKFFTDIGVKALFGAKGFDNGKAPAPEKVRTKVADAAKAVELDRKHYVKKAGRVIYEASQNDKSSGKWNERAALIEFLRHLYRARKTGAQDVWVYSPATDYPKPVFDELSGTDSHIKKRLGYDDEIFSAKERDLMCDALAIAQKISADAVVKLGAKEDATKTMIKDWFLDSGAADATLDEAIKKLCDGFKKISGSCGSTTLVFTDYLDWRKDRKKYFGGAIKGGEGRRFPHHLSRGCVHAARGQLGQAVAVCGNHRPRALASRREHQRSPI
jgi:hypothetical protein